MNTRHFILFLGLFALVTAGYFVATQTTVTEAQSLLTTETPGSQVTGTAGQQVLSLLQQLEGINFDTSLFTDPRYQNLQDFTVDVGAQAVGRDNPFLPANANGVVKNQAVNVPSLTLPQQ